MIASCSLPQVLTLKILFQTLSPVSWLKLFDAYNIKLDNKLELLPDNSD